MKKDLIKYLYCLNCKRDLQLLDYDNEIEISTGKLKCVNCNEIYSIIDGVPIFTKSDPNQKVKLTAQNFAYSWQKFSRINKEFYYKQFFDWIKPIDENFLKDKFILDAGCGKGHHLLMISPYIREAIGVDISDSVFIAYNNLKHLPNIHIIKADLNHLPLKDEIFDYIYSVGVVHHTESPKATTESLYKKVKKNGVISLWVYGKENNWWIIHFVGPVRKLITSIFSPAVIYLISLFLAVFLFLILKLIYLPTGKFKILRPLKKVLFYYSYFSYISKFDFIEINNIIFDHLIAPVTHYLSKADVQKLLELDFCKSDIQWHNRNSWRIQVQKKLPRQINVIQ